MEKDKFETPAQFRKAIYNFFESKGKKLKEADHKELRSLLKGYAKISVDLKTEDLNEKLKESYIQNQQLRAGKFVSQKAAYAARKKLKKKGIKVDKNKTEHHNYAKRKTL